MLIVTYVTHVSLITLKKKEKELLIKSVLFNVSCGTFIAGLSIGFDFLIFFVFLTFVFFIFLSKDDVECNWVRNLMFFVKCYCTRVNASQRFQIIVFLVFLIIIILFKWLRLKIKIYDYDYKYSCSEKSFSASASHF